ncbi:HAD family hydrolase [Verminephrobacter eiseniae]|uniref:HAD-superfamily hydrolase, subfamily IA, variant 3 n=1 Tax=Verminephrobacter eiseniae (strain EF01-2) TaxID=391735 RepID=A1WJJ1_VEREI|nr:HAD family phosphatase [Verminephrobacter eiseniae]ABM57798.1 HAD-superfamily hydrolase, subfamily IA, variant 3 [Verminephrobacter eiseniae EF01-2]MCW5283405.1 HAD family phosphatase [Verminephrobacter eiseniae]MCW5301114.1 HAD family phosphatase [Verminephrobacter eiseniae]MCW8182203.1 HAD family phosphatase [Verminephrobacter eiseniae]MCW8192647.1 HAD family phosphatase [Verminephrobacter eiseniae]
MPAIEMEAVVFDMDGVLIDSEVIWRQVRTEFCAENGMCWSAADQESTMGCNTAMWSRIMVQRLQLRARLGMDEAAIAREIKARLLSKYQARLPEREGAIAAVQRVATRYKVALASGSPNDIAAHVMRVTGLDRVFLAATYGDDVAQGKPAPDIYLDVLRKIGVAPQHALGVEDSGNGIRSLHAAGMGIIAAPGPEFALTDELLALADGCIGSMTELSLDMVRDIGHRRAGRLRSRTPG